MSITLPSGPSRVIRSWLQSKTVTVAPGQPRISLGVVNAPADFSTAINPVFGRDYVRAVARDELDVQRVVRYRIVRE